MAILSNIKSKMNDFGSAMSEIGSIVNDHTDENLDNMSSFKKIGIVAATITLFGAALAAYLFAPAVLMTSKLATYGITAGFFAASLVAITHPFFKKPVDGETLYSKIKANFAEPVQTPASRSNSSFPK